MTLQRAFINQRALEGEEDLPPLLTSRDVIRFCHDGRRQGAEASEQGRLVDARQGGRHHPAGCRRPSNVHPLNNVPGAVATLMSRMNVDTVLVAGRIRKWRGELVDVDVERLKRELEESRDYLFEAAGVEQDLFRT